MGRTRLLVADYSKLNILLTPGFIVAIGVLDGLSVQEVRPRYIYGPIIGFVVGVVIIVPVYMYRRVLVEEDRERNEELELKFRDNGAVAV